MSLRDKLDELNKWRKKPLLPNQNADPTQMEDPQAQTNPPGSANRQSQGMQAMRQSQGMPAAKQSQPMPVARPGPSLAELALQNLQGLEFSETGIQKADADQPPAEPVVEPTLPTSGMEGQVFNGLYRIEKLLAQGGMGQVFLAAHMNRNEMPVVLKLLLKQADRNSVEYNRFLQEMLISGRMRHPNLIKVFDYGILLDALTPYLVMEFAEGEPLRDVMRRAKLLSVPDAARIIMQCCDGLHEVHAKGVVHRDLKPENLMIKGDYEAVDNVKILDFGIAQLQNKTKFDEQGLAIGSVGYMSPEQICAQPVDHRTDIYSLGLIFYEAVTGHPPFVGSTRRETMAMHVQAKHMPPSSMATLPMGTMGPEVDRIVEQALAKHPDKRYQSVKDLQKDLAALEVAITSPHAT